jgi:vancomycin resistance protein YoaR
MRISFSIGIVALLSAGALFAHRMLLPAEPVLPGLTVDGAAVPPGDRAAAQAFIEGRAKALLAKRVALKAPDRDAPVLEASLEELGASVDVQRAVDAAFRIGKEGDLVSRARIARRAKEGNVDVPLALSIDRSATLARLAPVKELLDTSPVSARLDLDKHETVPEKEGRYLDVDDAIASLAMHAKDPAATSIALTFKTFAPRVSSAFLKSLEIASVVAEYETYFSRGGDQRKRGKNIDNAAQKLDGTVISPGELFSFNEIIGERSEANGFEKSWEIFKGEMVEGVGGGTCQVASTFHAATFFAGFDILERLPHSRPSAYIPMGLDSTVVYPAVDLKVRNPHPFPVVVHAKTIGNKLRVELLGKMRPVTVGFGRDVVATLAYKRKIEEDPALAGKKVVVKQHGIKGYKIKRSRVLTYPDGTRKKEEVTDTYPPTTEIYKVPVGFDVALLPALPSDGESTDPDLGENPSATPAAAKAPAAPGTEPSAASDVEFVDAPGAHAPTAAQKEPPKTIFLRR